MPADERDRLYEVAPGDFTRERNALAARLAEAGRDDAAREVRSLRRPSAAVFALNQAARARPDAVRELLALGSKGGRSPKEAQARERELLAELVAAAERALVAAGLGTNAQVLRRIESSLRAAPFASPDERRLVAEGRLARELELPGIEDVLARTAPRAPPRARDAGRASRAKKRDEERRAKLEREAARAAKEAEALMERARRAGEAARVAREKAAELERRRGA
ncbi:MAG TPA: hypothetical protein VFF73_22320 [Planctomycetota bacterium]|nr:hypothetical protein [Planctomycetota bacterium]